MRAGTFKPEYFFELDDDLIKKVRMDLRRSVLTVTVGYLHDADGVVDGYTTVFHVQGQPSVRVEQLGLWLTLRVRPLAWLPWLYWRRRVFL